MFGIPKELISQLQMRHNYAARVIDKSGKYDHITSVLVDLQWLPVKQRITYKAYAPAYIRELLVRYTQVRTIRFTEVV